MKGGSAKENIQITAVEVVGAGVVEAAEEETTGATEDSSPVAAELVSGIVAIIWVIRRPFAPFLSSFLS